MALAYLMFESNDGDYSRFKIDIGKNRFYSYAVGDEEVQRSNGLNMLRNRKFTSPLIGPLPESALGRGLLEIPNHQLDEDNPHVQLMSFRTKTREGPAISNIVRAGKSLNHINHIPGLPGLTSARSETMINPNYMFTVENIPFPYKESKYSSAMLLDFLESIIPKVLPQLSDLVGGLLGGGKGKKKGKIDASDIISLLTKLLKPGTAGTAGAAAPAAVSQSRALSGSPMYSQAAVAPALLTFLGPLLEKALNPETIKAILGNISPSKMIGTVTSGLKDLANLGIKSAEQDLKHLRAIHPSIDDPAFDKLLAGLSMSLSRNGGPDYRRVDSVKLKFAGITATMLYGRSRAAYRAGRDLSFPLAVETPRPTGKTVLFLEVKDPVTLEVAVKRKFNLENVMPGPLPLEPRLTAAQLSGLKPNEDYLVCAALVWKNKSGKKIGTSITQLITLVADYSFDRVEESGEAIPLNDINKYRAFWHKTWQDTLTAERKRIIFDCKYYLALEDNRDTNARMETLTQLESSGLNEETGRLKSGMILSPYVLNHLVPQISDYPMLEDAQLKAIQSPDFIDRFNRAARVRVKLKGRPGTSVALWNYPEVKLQRIILKKVQETGNTGNVTSFSEEPVYFPMPVLVHFIGARTQ